MTQCTRSGPSASTAIGGDHRRIDAARQAEHHAGEAVLARHSRAGPARMALPDLLARPRQRGDLARLAAASRRLARCQSVSATSSSNMRHLQRERAVGIEHEGGAVEDQLVLAADLVEIDERQAGLGDARDGELEADVIACRARRASRWARAGVSAPVSARRLADLLGPDVLADRHAEPHAAEARSAPAAGPARRRASRRTRRSSAGRA